MPFRLDLFQDTLKNYNLSMEEQRREREKQRAADLAREYLTESEILSRLDAGMISLADAVHDVQWLWHRDKLLDRAGTDREELHEPTEKRILDLVEKDRVEYWKTHDVPQLKTKSVMSDRDQSPAPPIRLAGDLGLAVAFCLDHKLMNSDMALLYRARYKMPDDLVNWLQNTMNRKSLDMMMRDHKRDLERAYLDEIEAFARNHGFYVLDEVLIARYTDRLPFWTWAFESQSVPIMNRVLERVYKVRKEVILSGKYDRFSMGMRASPYLTWKEPVLEEDIIHQDLDYAEDYAKHGPGNMELPVPDPLRLLFTPVTDEEKLEQSEKFKCRYVYRNGSLCEQAESLPKELKALLAPDHILTLQEYNSINRYLYQQQKYACRSTR